MVETMSVPRYEITFNSVMMWAKSELDHVGRIASMKDEDLQHAYAMSTLYGMAHLKDALYELVTDPAYENHQTDLQKTHDAVVRTMRHLKKQYTLDVGAINAFNTRGVLSNLSYLEDPSTIYETPESPTQLNVYNTTKNGLEQMQNGGRSRKVRKSRNGKSRKAIKSKRVC